MLLVKTKIKSSEIAGIGLFADEFIPKGTCTWRFRGGSIFAFQKIIRTLYQSQQKLSFKLTLIKIQKHSTMYSVQITLVFSIIQIHQISVSANFFMLCGDFSSEDRALSVNKVFIRCALTTRIY